MAKIEFPQGVDEISSRAQLEEKCAKLKDEIHVLKIEHLKVSSMQNEINKEYIIKINRAKKELQVLTQKLKTM